MLVDIVVESARFTVSEVTLQQYPESYFCAALKPHWDNGKTPDNRQELTIVGRSATLFPYVVTYLQTSCLPRTRTGHCPIPVNILEALREEADYFLLPGMIDEIDEAMRLPSATRFARTLAVGTKHSVKPQKNRIGLHFAYPCTSSNEVGMMDYEQDRFIGYLANMFKSQNIANMKKVFATLWALDLSYYLKTYSHLGVFTAYKYFETALRPASLQGSDKVLYEWATTKGVPVSLLYVQLKREYLGKDTTTGFPSIYYSVYMLDPESDTRLAEHRSSNVNDHLPFIQLTAGGAKAKYGIDKKVDTDDGMEGKEDYSFFTIETKYCAAFILG